MNAGCRGTPPGRRLRRRPDGCGHRSHHENVRRSRSGTRIGPTSFWRLRAGLRRLRGTAKPGVNTKTAAGSPGGAARQGARLTEGDYPWTLTGQRRRPRSRPGRPLEHDQRAVRRPAPSTRQPSQTRPHRGSRYGTPLTNQQSLDQLKNPEMKRAGPTARPPPGAGRCALRSARRPAAADHRLRRHPPAAGGLSHPATAASRRPRSVRRHLRRSAGPPLRR